MLLSFSDFIGRFHPVLVHIPIGILLLGCFFQLLTFRERFRFLQPAIPIIIFWGMAGSLLSAISGYFLANSGDYEGGIVEKHQWFGIITAILSIVLYLLYKGGIKISVIRWISLLLILLVFITGHLGGSLTHGENYLTEGLNRPPQNEKGPVLKAIPNIQEASVYLNLVQPILQARCYSCHGPNKRKGKLRLDSPDFILKGGEDEPGKAIVPGKPEESEMIRRISLPLKHEDHMAPKEKAQLTQNEIALLRWWVSTGSDFTKKVKELEQSAEIRPVLKELQSGTSTIEKTVTDIPEIEVKPASVSAIESLRKSGVMIIPVAQNSNYLSANFVTVQVSADSLLKLLLPLEKQLIWLKLDHAAITDSSLKEIGKLKSLTRLQLSNTRITDKGLAELKSLDQLQSLNLVGTQISSQGIMQLKLLKKLNNLYLFQTKISGSEWFDLQKAFPQTKIDSGKYYVPMLPTDTVEVKF
jgi:uncharacterized membrane protein/mono/diheme cytochrome c family protein